MPTESHKPSGSLADLLAELLAVTEVPVATTTMRILCSVLRGEEVTAERLARVASFEREHFVKTRRPPRLCHAINPDGTAPRRRVWAAGDWRTARRIITPDSQRPWHAAAGILVCNLVLERGFDDERLPRLAHELGAQALGPLGAFEPRSEGEWAEMRMAMLGLPIGPGFASHSVEQGEAEKALKAAELTGLALYFGLDQGGGILRRPRPAELRLALPGEPGAMPFDDLVERRAEDRDLARSVLAYIEAYGRQLDELGLPPTPSQFAERWDMTLPEVAATRNRFAMVFPAEDDPAAMSAMLWDGAVGGREVFSRLLGVQVVADSGSPAVISFFLASIADETRDELGTRAAHEAMQFGDSPSDPRRELKRFFALCARAVDVWCADALAARRDEGSLAGLHSLEPVSEERTARYTEALLGEYRLSDPGGAGGPVMLATQKALRVASSLRALEPPRSTTPYLDGIRWAAKALVAAQQELGTDLVTETRLTAERLDAVI